MRVRQYVAVELKYTCDGKCIPLAIDWEDGRQFKIDKIGNVHHCASKTGAFGLCYVCMIGGKWRNLFYEDPCWFVEKKIRV